MRMTLEGRSQEFSDLRTQISDLGLRAHILGLATDPGTLGHVNHTLLSPDASLLLRLVLPWARA